MKLATLPPAAPTPVTDSPDWLLPFVKRSRNALLRLVSLRNMAGGFVSLAKPPGCRSTTPSLGGTWDFVRVDGGRLHNLTELEQICAVLPSDLDRSIFRSEFGQLLRRAAAGRLSYGADGDVDVIRAQTDVLEIRMMTRRSTSGDDLLIRMYFSEPDTHPELLLGLLLTWKSPGPLGLEEQNAHAAEAQRRCDAWRASQAPPRADE